MINRDLNYIERQAQPTITDILFMIIFILLVLIAG